MSFSVSLRAQLWFCIPKVSSGYMSIYNSMFHVLQCFSTCTALVLHTQGFLWLYVDIYFHVSCPSVFLYVHSSGFAYPRFPLVICRYITPCFMSFSVSLRAQLWFCIPKVSSGYMSMYNSMFHVLQCFSTCTALVLHTQGVSSGYMSIYNSMFHVLQCFSTCTALVLHTQGFLWLYVDI